MANNSGLSAGTMLRNGTYRIVRFLGQGGFGCTYEAVFEKIGARVAIKEFFPQSVCNRDASGRMSIPTDSNVEFVEKLRSKFVNEARTLYVNQNIEGVVKVKDIFDENDTSYFVMDFVDGKSIQSLIEKNGSMPEDEALRIITEVGRALQSVHSHNCLHLDIKPDNIMIGADGHPVLIDFGVSKQYSEEDGCNTSTLMGYTPGFAPIEQMNANVRAFLPATDVYALGATLYAMLTGQRPPKASDILNDTETLDFPSTISPTTRQAIEAAMSPRVKDRPQSVADFVSMLPGNDKRPPIEVTANRTFSPTQPIPKPNNHKKHLWIFFTPTIVALTIFLIWKLFTTKPLTSSTDSDSIVINDSIKASVDTVTLVQHVITDTSNGHPTDTDHTNDSHKQEDQIPQKQTKSPNEILSEAKTAYNNKDYAKALTLFRQIDNNSEAQYYIGKMYDFGLGLPQDYSTAFRWYRKAADKGDYNAQSNLGVMYVNGNGVAQNHTEAVRWFRKSAAQGCSEGQYNLGVMYYNGEGVDMDLKEAAKWFEKAANQGHEYAQYHLGDMYKLGNGVKSDYEEAMQWFLKAVEHGNTEAMMEIGDLYKYGHGVTQNYLEAMNWWRKAADLGNTKGFVSIGLLYYNGRGVDKDNDEAAKWWRKAADMGDRNAIDYLERLIK